MGQKGYGPHPPVINFHGTHGQVQPIFVIEFRLLVGKIRAQSKMGSIFPFWPLYWENMEGINNAHLEG